MQGSLAQIGKDKSMAKFLVKQEVFSNLHRYAIDLFAECENWLEDNLLNKQDNLGQLFYTQEVPC